MDSDNEIVRFKTDAWADPRMVEWYARRVTENIAENRLKNRLETGLVRTLARGVDILDVGIGTGRASLPLLDDGVRLSGIDSSQAMLDECRRRVDGRPIDLRVGDVHAIPYGDASFDSLVSLNVMTHFPNWQEVLREWLRVLRPGGRLVFDIYSRDHIEAILAQRGPGLEHLLPEQAAAQPKSFNMRVRVDELAQFAREQGITLVAVHPYCGTLGGDHNYWMQGSWADGRVWERAKSWIADDDKLYEFLLFLEEHGYAHLPATAGARFMVAFEKRADAGETAALLERQERLAAALAARPLRLSTLVPWLDLPAGEWRLRFNRHLDHPRNRLTLFQMLTAGLPSGLEVDLYEWLEQRYRELFDRWLLAFQLDRQVWQLASGWHRALAYAELLEYKGVQLGPGLEYATVQTMMRAALGETGEADDV